MLVKEYVGGDGTGNKVVVRIDPIFSVWKFV